jgi:hypothetical protein
MAVVVSSNLCDCRVYLLRRHRAVLALLNLMPTGPSLSAPGYEALSLRLAPLYALHNTSYLQIL